MNLGSTKIRILKTPPLVNATISIDPFYMDKYSTTSHKVEKTDKDFTEEEETIMKQFDEDFELGYLNMNIKFDEFNDRTLPEICEILADKYNIRLKKRLKTGQVCDKDDWRFDTKHPLIHTKIITIISYILNANKGVTFQVFNENDTIDINTGEAFNRILTNLEKASGSRYETGEMHNALNAAIFPVSIQKIFLEPNYEDFWHSGAYTQTVPIQNFFIANPYVRHLQDQRFVIESYNVPFISLKSMFPNSTKLDFIKVGAYSKYETQGLSYLKHKILPEGRVSKDSKKVVVQEYYNKSKKIYAVFVNGVLVESKKFEGSYPYRATKYRDFANVEMFYGLSLAQILLPAQMTFDTLMNLALNTEVLNTDPSFFVSGSNVGDVEDNLNRPGAVVVSGEGTMINPMRPPISSNGLMNAISLEKNILNESSADGVTGGQSAKYTSARGQVMAQNNFNTILGYFDKQITNAKLDYSFIIMEQILKNLTYKKLNDMGIPIYQSLFTEEDKGVLFDITPVNTHEELIEKSLKLLKTQKDLNKKLIELNPEQIKKLRYRIYSVVEPEYMGTTQEKQARMVNNYKLLTQIYQFDAQKINQLTEVFAPFLATGVSMPKGFFDKAPVVAGQGQQTGGYLSGGQEQMQKGDLNTKSFDNAGMNGALSGTVK
jgi:hypothetical protein